MELNKEEFFATIEYHATNQVLTLYGFISLLFHPVQVVKNDEIEDLRESLHRGGVIARKSVGEPLGLSAS